MTELPLVGLLKSPDPIRDDVLRTFGDEEEPATRFAVKWAWMNRRVKMDQKVAAVWRLASTKRPTAAGLNGTLRAEQAASSLPAKLSTPLDMGRRVAPSAGIAPPSNFIDNGL